MARIPGLRRYLRLPRRSTREIESELEEEFRFHLDMATAELAARGLDPAAARAAALRRFGDADDARRYIRAMAGRSENATRRRETMSGIRQDVTHAWRGLRRTPAFAIVVVVALALGIGATTAIFTLMNAVLLRELPVPNADELVGFGDPSLVRSVSQGAPRTDLFSYPLYVDLRERTRAVPALLAAGASGPLDVTPAEPGGAAREPEHPRGRLVSGNYFQVLGIRAAVGRALTPDDDTGPDAGAVAVVSHAYWERGFGLDPGILGRVLLVNRVPVTVVGVAPEGFLGEAVGDPADLWMPLSMQPLLMANQERLRDRDTNWLLLMGRLAPGATPAAAAAELSQLARRSLEEGGARPGPGEARVEAYSARRGSSAMRGQIAAPMATLMALAVLVLLVVCANVANLLLARATSRRTEIGVRLALGAGRLRVMRHLLTESILLGAAAGALALVVVQMGKVLLLRKAEAEGGANLDISIDLRVFAFAAALSLLTAVALGLVPAARATKVELGSALRAYSRGVSGGPLGGGGRRLGFGKWLVIGQIAVSLVLLAGAGLFVRSVENLESTEIGVAREELLMVPVDARPAGYSGPRAVLLHEQLIERLRRLPGVRGVTYSQTGLFSGMEITTRLHSPGFTGRTASDSVVSLDWVGPGYFHTVGARLLRGRDIEPRDRDRASPVAVINQRLARFYFGGGDPIGRYVQTEDGRYEVVGVVADITGQSLRTRPARQLYTPLAQEGGSGNVIFQVRTVGDPTRAIAAVRRELLAAEPAMRVPEPRPLDDIVRRSVSNERMLAMMSGAAGSLALLLAAVGLYGVMTYTIARRTGEFGLRIALGAKPSDVTRMVLRETMVLLLVGAAIGIPIALAAARLLRNQLADVGMVDLPSLAAALGVLAPSAALAGYRPASRAAHVQPQVALSRE